MCVGVELAALGPAIAQMMAAAAPEAAAAATAGTALATGAGAAATAAPAITAAEIAALTEGGLLGTKAAEGGGLLANAAYNAMLPGIGSEQAAALATKYGMAPGVGSQQAGLLAAQTGEFGLAGLGKTMEAAAGAQGLNPLQAAAGKVGGGLLGAGGGAAGTKELMAAKMGMEMMQPQPMQQGPQAPPMQAQQGPLNNPYGPGGNSLGTSNMSEAEKKRLRALGYQV